MQLHGLCKPTLHHARMPDADAEPGFDRLCVPKLKRGEYFASQNWTELQIKACVNHTARLRAGAPTILPTLRDFCFTRYNPQKTDHRGRVRPNGIRFCR